MLLDEPTNHLDVKNVAWLQDYLNSLPDVTSMVRCACLGLFCLVLLQELISAVVCPFDPKNPKKCTACSRPVHPHHATICMQRMVTHTWSGLRM